MFHLRPCSCLLLVWLALLPAADGGRTMDQWGLVATAQRKEVPTYRRYLDRERAWFHERVVIPYLRQPGKKPLTEEQLRAVLVTAGLAACDSTLTSPMNATQALDLLAPQLEGPVPKRGDPILAFAAWRLSADGPEQLLWGRRCRALWLGDAAQWSATYPATVPIEMDNYYLIVLKKDPTPALLARHTEIARRLAASYEKAWKSGEFTGRERAVLPLLREASLRKPGADAYIPRVKALFEKRGDWLGHAAQGCLAINQARAARGDGPASTVSEASWRIVDEQTAVAQRELTAAWALDPSLPEPAAGLIATAFWSKDRQTAFSWFTKAIAAEFDFPGAYTTMLEFLRPRWYGSVEDVADFGNACLDTGRFDTEVPSYLLRALSSIHEDSADRFTTIYGTAQWKGRVGAVVEGYVASTGRDAPFVHTIRSEQAFYLWTVGDRSGATAILDALPREAVAWNLAGRWGLTQAVVTGSMKPQPGEADTTVNF